MQYMHLPNEAQYRDTGPGKFLVHDSPYVKILVFSLREGQELPLHSHDDEGYASHLVLEGEGVFLKEDGEQPAKAGDIVVCEIREPHGVRATNGDMQVIAHIAPPI